jgi:hypothetical protein
MRKPILLDELLTISRETMREIDGRWFIAKPVNIYTGFLERLHHAWLILCGRAVAVQYGEDRLTPTKFWV